MEDERTSSIFSPCEDSMRIMLSGTFRLITEKTHHFRLTILVVSTADVFSSIISNLSCGHGSLVVKVSDRGWHVTSLSPVPLKTRRVGE
ncbi:hypothetical protein TNCV_1571691 [Trichonephila clavipes]|uniref:Uncharacterized protein n=1 Tax=Trichonephila clavipes TaxID=2585209 RepID=A0A8X6SPR5_TRICX|nr:hypothetical protein TNCV_1571691 [Trichonephila clavipes]